MVILACFIYVNTVILFTLQCNFLARALGDMNPIVILLFHKNRMFNYLHEKITTGCQTYLRTSYCIA
jgi:hypothetical protein